MGSIYFLGFVVILFYAVVVGGYKSDYLPMSVVMVEYNKVGRLLCAY